MEEEVYKPIRNRSGGVILGGGLDRSTLFREEEDKRS